MPALLRNILSVASRFQLALVEMRKSKSIEEFEKEFSEVLEVLNAAANSRKQIINRCQELSTELALCQKKLMETQTQVSEFQEAYNKLKEDLTKASKCMGDQRENEIKYKELISKLELKLMNMENEKDASVPEKEQAFEIEAERERKLLNSRILQLESDLKLKESEEKEVKSKLFETLDAVTKLEENLEALRLKLKQELGRSQNVAKDRLFTEQEVHAKQSRIIDLEETVSRLKWKIDELGKKINSYEQRVMGHQEKINTLQKLHRNTKDQAKTQVEEFKNISIEKDRLLLLLQRKDEDLKSLNGKLIDILNEKESMLQRYLHTQNQNQSSEAKREQLEKQLLNREKEMLKVKKQQTQHDSELSVLVREKELLAQNILKMESIVDRCTNEMKLKEKDQITLYQDLKNSKLKIERQGKIIDTLVKIKQQLLNDVKDLTKKIENLNNDLCCQVEKEATLQANLIKLTSELSQQKDICSGAIVDRKIFCQKYKEMKENRDLLKQKIDILENYINDLSESQYSKNEEIKSLQQKLQLVDQQIHNQANKLAQAEKNNTALATDKSHLEEETKLYLQTISLKEEEVKSFKSKINSLSEECKLLRSQHKQQVREIITLEEKLKNSEIAVARENKLYAELENGTKLLHLEILRLTGEKNTLMCQVNDLQKLKQSFTYAKQELHNERHKNSALEAAMQQPINVHRWRLLKGTDPEKHELIENYQTVQRQLLKKSIETEKKDKKISKMAKLVDQLKGMTSRGKYFEEKCLKDADLHRLLKEKNDKIKALSFEVNMNETYMAHYQEEMSHLKEEVQKMKLKQFFREKRITPVKPSVNYLKSETQLKDCTAPELRRLIYKSRPFQQETKT